MTELIPAGLKTAIAKWAGQYDSIRRVMLYASRNIRVGRDGDPPPPDSDLSVIIEMFGKDDEKVGEVVDARVNRWHEELAATSRQYVDWTLHLEIYRKGQPTVSKYVNAADTVVYEAKRGRR